MILSIRLYASPPTSLIALKDSLIIGIFVIKSQQYLPLGPKPKWRVGGTIVLYDTV